VAFDARFLVRTSQRNTLRTSTFKERVGRKHKVPAAITNKPVSDALQHHASKVAAYHAIRASDGLTQDEFCLPSVQRALILVRKQFASVMGAAAMSLTSEAQE